MSRGSAPDNSNSRERGPEAVELLMIAGGVEMPIGALPLRVALLALGAAALVIAAGCALAVLMEA
jgi:hypothetical protein